jgi:hypothetical protein
LFGFPKQQSLIQIDPCTHPPNDFYLLCARTTSDSIYHRIFDYKFADKVKCSVNIMNQTLKLTSFNTFLDSIMKALNDLFLIEMYDEIGRKLKSIQYKDIINYITNLISSFKIGKLIFDLLILLLENELKRTNNQNIFDLGSEIAQKLRYGPPSIHHELKTGF